MEKCSNCGAPLENGVCSYCGTVNSQPQQNQGMPRQNQGIPPQFQGMGPQFQNTPQYYQGMPNPQAFMPNNAPYGGYPQYQPKRHFWQKELFLYLMIAIAPYIGIILLWTVHKDNRNLRKVSLSFIAVIWFLFILGASQMLKSDDYSSTGDSNTEYTAVDEDADTAGDLGVVGEDAAETSEASDSTQEEVLPAEDLSGVATEYELSTGNYTAGIDIPAGKSNIAAVSGTGNLSSSNMFTGGINEMFGIDDGTGFYTESYQGLKLSEGDVLTVSGRLTIKMEYTDVQSDITERVYDEDNRITLTDGSYEVGTDFPEGLYNIEAVSGTGNLSSSNMFEGGLSEMFGIDDGMGFYTGEAKNIPLPAGATLEISGGLKVELIPCE